MEITVKGATVSSFTLERVTTEMDATASEFRNEQTWLDDSVEVFLDGDNRDDTMNLHNAEQGEGEFEGQYVMTAHGARRDNKANNPPFGRDAQWLANGERRARAFFGRGAWYYRYW